MEDNVHLEYTLKYAIRNKCVFSRHLKLARVLQVLLKLTWTTQNQSGSRVVYSLQTRNVNYRRAVEECIAVVKPQCDDGLTTRSFIGLG